jgi:hypothetical protein
MSDESWEPSAEAPTGSTQSAKGYYRAKPQPNPSASAPAGSRQD